MRSARFGLLLFFGVVSIPILAQQGPALQTQLQTPEQASQAATLIQSSLTAQNGGASITDVTLTGIATVTQGAATNSGTVVLTALANGQSQTTLTLPTGVQTTLLNYSVQPPTGKSIAPDGTSRDWPLAGLVGPHPAWYFPQFIMASGLSSKYLASDLGQEQWEGAAARHVVIWRSLGANSASPTAANPQPGQQDLYLNPTTLLPVALAFNLVGTNKDKRVKPFKNVPIYAREEVRFSDYRLVQGRPVAFHIQAYLQNTYHAGNIDAIDLLNGSLSVDIPLFSYTS